MAGLHAAKCPSCRIVLLRRLANSQLYQCPACGLHFARKYPLPVPVPPSSIGVDTAEASALLQQQSICEGGSERGKVVSARLRAERRHSFQIGEEGKDKPALLNTSVPLPTQQPPLDEARATHYDRRGSLGRGTHPATSSRERLQLPDIKDTPQEVPSAERSSRLGRLKQFFTSPVWSRKSSPRSDCSSASSAKGLELPPITYRTPSEGSGSDSSLIGERKPCLTSSTQLRLDFTAMQESGNFDHLQELYTNTFSSWDELCCSFGTEQCGSDFSSSLAVDMEFVQFAFSLLMKMHRNVQQAVLKAIVSGIIREHRSYRHYDASCNHLRAHLILIENPQFYNASTYVVFAQLLKQLAKLPAQSHLSLTRWLQEYKPDHFREIIAKVQQFISVRLFPPDPSELPSSSKSTWWLSSAAKVLALLNEANLQCYPPLVSHWEFYNSTLDHIDLMAEYYAWQSPHSHTANQFSFCQYPFLLSMAAKKAILQKDSEHQMLIMAKRSIAEKVQQNAAPHARHFFLNLNVRRSHLIADSISELMQKQEDLKKKVRVTFSGEPGVDVGGLSKEWFLLLIRKVFQPEYGLFVYHEDSGCYWFNPGLTKDFHNEYHLVGLLMGLAVYNSIILDLRFPLCCYKKLLSPTAHKVETPGRADIKLHDLAGVMPTLSRSLQQLLDYTGCVEHDMCYTFQVAYKVFDASVTFNLRPNGNQIPVTNINKEEFVSLYIEHILNDSIANQFAAFYHGFHRVCDSNALLLFCPEEVEMLVCGSPTIDMRALEGVTLYDGYTTSESTIRNFWEVVHSLTVEQQRSVLLFVTGSHRVPIGGMESMHFKISKLPFPSPTRTNILPMAQTCFNHLLLPPYKTKKRLREKLTIALGNAEGFGME